jgi:HKD family nuclease
VKEINAYYELQPRKSKDDLIDQIMPIIGTKLEAVVSRDGPFSLSKWNDIIKEFEGSPRKSFKDASIEIEECIDPVYDEFHRGESLAELYKRKSKVNRLARKLGADLEELTTLIEETHGNTLLSTFVKQYRKINQPKSSEKKPTAHMTESVASTKTISDAVEKLDLLWVKNFISGADKVEIAAGFYDVKFLNGLLDNHSKVKQIRMVFNGLGGQRLKDQINELQILTNNLKSKRISVEIRLAFAPGMFHSKLFLATEGSSTRALIGSANATLAAFARNEEILVTLPKADTLAGYFDSIWNEAKHLDRLDVTAKSLIAFFRTGSLYFKPTVTISLTINPFRELLKTLSPDELQKLSGFKLPHADPESGIGPFNLKLAVLGDATPIDDSEDMQSIKAGIKPWSIETCYGYWVPSAVDNKWSEKLKDASESRRNKWIKFRDALDRVSETDLCKSYKNYLDAVGEVLERIPGYKDKIKHLKNNPFDSAESTFNKFVKRIKCRLLDDQLDQLTMPFRRGKIPELWDDDGAYEDFRDSFFDYMALILPPNFGHAIKRRWPVRTAPG